MIIGGDHILNYSLEKLKIDLLGLDDEDRDNVMGKLQGEFLNWVR